MNNEEKRLEVAIELATKEGQSFESLPEVMKEAFLHNADCAIADREGKVLSKTGEVITAYSCSVCKDAGWIEGKSCYECNPVGLKKEEIYPVAKTETLDDSVSGTGPDNQPARSGDTGEPAKPQKPKAKKKARKKSR